MKIFGASLLSPPAALVLMLALVLTGVSGCLEIPDPEPGDAYLVLDSGQVTRLPLSPHVISLRARPTPDMAEESQGIWLEFRLLNKRTLQVDRIDVQVGGSFEGPWGGRLKLTAFLPDLLVHEGEALHGHEGHVNPAVWVTLTDHRGRTIHEGWFFSRDPSRTAWDHHRFDLTFLGPGVDPATRIPHPVPPPLS